MVFISLRSKQRTGRCHDGQSGQTIRAFNPVHNRGAAARLTLRVALDRNRHFTSYSDYYQAMKLSPSNDPSNHSKTGCRLVFAISLVAACFLAVASSPAKAAQSDGALPPPYVLDTGLLSRSISFENPTGEPGAGGKAASNLGPGRKGAPARDIKPGETVQLCDIKGPGVIRHMWMTTEGAPLVQRACIIRVWWEG
jgi:hypothetical protein